MKPPSKNDAFPPSATSLQDARSEKADLLARDLARCGSKIRHVLESQLADSQRRHEVVRWLTALSKEATCRDASGREVSAITVAGQPDAERCARWLTFRAVLASQASSSADHGGVSPAAPKAALPRQCASAENVPRHTASQTAISTNPVQPDACHAIAPLLAELDSIVNPSRLSQVVQEFRLNGDASSAVGHLYERFLARFSARQRKNLGVYYTPRPLVDYILNSVDLVLRDTWNLPHGLASTRRESAPWRLRIVDPSCGCGTFLIPLAQRMMRRDWATPESRDLDDAADRLLGFDLDPVACWIATSTLSHVLHEPPGTPTPNVDGIERGASRLAAGGSLGATSLSHSVILANALEQASIWDPALHRGTMDSARHDLSPVYKTTDYREPDGDREPNDDGQRPLPVIVGNPPYGNFGQRNQNAWIRRLLQDYKHGLGERKLNLDDDFIKFLRWSQYVVDAAGAGVVALVTNNTYLTGLTHRRLRQSLLESFDEIFVLDLHGDRKRDQAGTSGSLDENVFAIQQGVAIGVFVKTGSDRAVSRLWHADWRGSRATKLERLAHEDVSVTEWKAMAPERPASFFAPRRGSGDSTYRSFAPLDEVFTHYTSGIQTKADRILVDPRRGRLARRMRQLLTDPAADQRDAPIGLLQRVDRHRVSFELARIRPYVVAPFDIRWIYYDPRLVGRARWKVARHLMQSNLALLFMRQSTNAGSYDHFLAISELASDRAFYSAHGAPFLAPLWLFDDDGRATSNFREPFLQAISKCWNLTFDDRANDGQLKDSFGPYDVFHYLYGICHATEYRRRYEESLRVDFPRMPLTLDVTLAREIVKWGRVLTSLHTLGPDSSHFPDLALVSGGEIHVSKGYPRFEEGDAIHGHVGESRPGRLCLNVDAHLSEVRAEEWDFRLGGYAVLQRWLAARRNRRLRPGEVTHLKACVSAVRQTLAAVRQIDNLLSPWPWQ